MDPIWTNLPTELYVHIIGFIPDAVVRRDLGLKPRKMLSIPQIAFPRSCLKDVEEMHQDQTDNFIPGKTIRISCYPRYFFFELFDGQQVRQVKFDRDSGNVKTSTYEGEDEMQLWDKANVKHLQVVLFN